MRRSIWGVGLGSLSRAAVPDWLIPFAMDLCLGASVADVASLIALDFTRSARGTAWSKYMLAEISVSSLTKHRLPKEVHLFEIVDHGVQSEAQARSRELSWSLEKACRLRQMTLSVVDSEGSRVYYTIPQLLLVISAIATQTTCRVTVCCPYLQPNNWLSLAADMIKNRP